MKSSLQSCLNPLLQIHASDSHSFFSRGLRFLSTAVASPSPSPSPQEADLSHEAPKNIFSILLPSELTSSKLNEDHIGSYYLVNQSLLPEVPLTLGTSAPKARSRSCTSLQDETSSTRLNAIMNRESIHNLRESLIHQRLPLGLPASPNSPNSSTGLKRVLIKGPIGSGKSIALASLVETARSMGWISLYLPCASTLIKGGYFSRREDGSYDTLLSAQEVLRATSEAHGKELAALRLLKDLTLTSIKATQSFTTSSSLLDVVNAGLSPDADSRLAVDCCMNIKRELLTAAASPGSTLNLLFAIDDYDSLFTDTTGYGCIDEESGERRSLRPEELTLASSFRLLSPLSDDHVLGSGARGQGKGQVVVVAASSSNSKSLKAQDPRKMHMRLRSMAREDKVEDLDLDEDVTTLHMPRYSLAETAHALYFYAQRGLAPHVPTEQQVKSMQVITNGNGKEVRHLAPKLSLVQDGYL